MIFDNRPIAEITESELTGLIGNQEENQWVDFKQKAYDVEDKGEICKDVTAMANTDGGYILIGVSEKNKVAKGFFTVPDAGKIAQSINGICLQHIDPRIQNLKVEPKSFQWNGTDIKLVIIRVPPSGTRPHGFTWKGSTNFVKRYGDHTREYPISELVQDLLELRYPPIIGQIDGKLDTILKKMGGVRSSMSPQDPAADNRRHPSARVRSSMSPQDNALEERGVGDLLDLMKLRFQEATSGEPYYRILAVPETLNPDAVSTQADRIRALLRDPPDRRYANFGVTGFQEISSTAEGISAPDTSRGGMTLLRNGLIEVRCPLSGSSQFQWRRNDFEIPTTWWLYPHVVCEFPVTFLRLVKAIYAYSRINSRVLIQQEYHNLTEFTLIGGQPASIFFGLLPIGQGVYEQPQPIVSKQTVNPDFVPDHVAYDLVKEVYDSFGLNYGDIPDFDENGNFILK